MMHIVQLAEVTPQPWRNGGGITRELLLWPDADDWLLRISLAEVVRDGPFSPYPGYERHFAVVQGAGVVLSFGDDDHKLTPESAPQVFDGAQPPDCTLIDGPTLDLNLLVRQDAGSGLLRAVALGERWALRAPLRAVYTRHAAELLVHGRPVAMLAPQTLAYSTADQAEPWQLLPAGAGLAAWWLAFTPQVR